MKKYLTALAFTVVLAGCAQVGNKFDIAKADALQPGVATLDEAKAQLGAPTSVTTDAEGNQTVRWKYVTASPIGAQGARIDIVFDKQGKMVRVAHRGTVGI